MKQSLIIVICAFLLMGNAARSAEPQASKGKTPLAPQSAESTLAKEELFASMPLEYADIVSLPGEFFNEGKENENDPAYKLYKEGYGFILDERWQDARKKFAEVIAKYKKSAYVDDASYWSAYSLKSIDKKQAIKAYKEFMAKYPNSSYFDDAVADLSELTQKHHSASSNKNSNWNSNSGSNSSSSSTIASAWATSDDDSSDGDDIHVYSSGNGRGYGYGYTVTPKASSALMMKLDRSMQHLRMTAPRLARIPRMPQMPRAAYAPMPFGSSWESDDTLDEKTKVKMEALYAIGDTKEDSVSYRTLRNVAIDPTQPRELRLTALDALSDFKKFDVLPDFISVASNDKDEEVQNSAIKYISDLGDRKDKNRGVDALIKLYGMLPAEKKDQRETIFYTIADIGNDKAVDFLINVARDNKDYELRSQAIYYLGNIGGEKARVALYDILKDK